MKQSAIFLQGEADNWFLRNKDQLVKNYNDIDWISHSLQPFSDQINSVLEIGCSNGIKLNKLSQFFNAQGYGIDPSSLAVEEGNATWNNQNIQLQTGTASSLPYPNQSLDLVYFGFCLYLLDRSDLLAAVAEVDRVLKKGGFVAITDFDPIARHKRPYHHREGVFSYKQDYAKLFTESGLYYLVAKNSFSHRQPFFDLDTNERVSTTLLYKEIDAY